MKGRNSTNAMGGLLCQLFSLEASWSIRSTRSGLRVKVVSLQCELHMATKIPFHDRRDNKWVIQNGCSFSHPRPRSTWCCTEVLQPRVEISLLKQVDTGKSQFTSRRLQDASHPILCEGRTQKPSKGLEFLTSKIKKIMHFLGHETCCGIYSCF